jgi:hypothetical protein
MFRLEIKTGVATGEFRALYSRRSISINPTGGIMREPQLSDAIGFDRGRRSFLKLGVMGSLAFGTVGLSAGLAGCHRQVEASAQGFKFLRDADLKLFRALIPVITRGTLPEDGKAREARVVDILHRVDLGCWHLNAPGQGELLKLFDLLNMGVTRRLAAGVSLPWDHASEDDVDAFLNRWRSSFIGPFNAGYRVLTKLVAVSNYSIAAVWPSAGYPGPLDSMYKAVNS